MVWSKRDRRPIRRTFATVNDAMAWRRPRHRASQLLHSPPNPSRKPSRRSMRLVLETGQRGLALNGIELHRVLGFRLTSPAC
jgi:hypothetical protein